MNKLLTNKNTILFILFVVLPCVSQAGITYQEGDKYITIGGRIQMQYHQLNPDNGETTDALFLRRFRPYIEGSAHKNWKAKLQWDMGKAENDNELAVKDAYIQYKTESDIKVRIGNAAFPFSREQLTSSKKQLLVERTFTGDHNYGVPENQLGIHLESSAQSMMWAASLVEANIDPDNKKLDFDTPVNADDDFNEGFMLGTRVEFYFGGKVKFSQGDFDGNSRSSLAMSVFSWSNDDDNNIASATKSPVDSVSGIELSAAYRGHGASIDVQFNTFDAETVDPSITDGIYKNGNTTLESASLEMGYMLVPAELELALGYQTLDADNYADAWNRTSLGVNCYIDKHNIKVQLSYRMGKNLDGITDNDEDEIFIQTQYVF